MDQEFDAAERGSPGDPRQRLTGAAARHQSIEERVVVARPGDELARLVFGGDEPGAREQRGETVDAVQTGRPRKER
jgi:hypothetical protein